MLYYDFECRVCTELIEIEEPIAPVCTSCGAIMFRIWSAVPTHFKGSGFYSTGG